MAAEVGFSPPRFVSTALIDPEREDFKKVLGDAKFVATEYRLFKLPEKREGPKQVIYKGNIAGCENEFAFDHQTTFRTGVAVEVDSELATILSCSRYKGEFDFKPSSQTNITAATQEIHMNHIITKLVYANVIWEKHRHMATRFSYEIDPFAYLEEKIKRGEKVAVRCCGGGEKKEAPACCGSEENKADSGCFGAKKEGSGCGDKTESGSCAGQKCC